MENIYFVYVHYLPNSIPFYVGLGKYPPIHKRLGIKTKYGRAFCCGKKARNDLWHAFTKTTKHTVSVIKDDLSLGDARLLEQLMIHKYGKIIDGTGCLTNLLDSYRATGYSHRRSLRVSQLTLDGKLVKIWEKPVHIKRELGFIVPNIIKCCRKTAITAHGYKWEYTDYDFFKKIIPTATRNERGTQKNISVEIINEKNKVIKYFTSLIKAAEYLKIDRKILSRNLKNNKQPNVRYAKNIVLPEVGLLMEKTLKFKDEKTTDKQRASGTHYSFLLPNKSIS